MEDGKMKPFPPNAAALPKFDPLVIAYVVFIDMVGYGKLSDVEQAAAQNCITELIRNMPDVIQGRVEGDLIIRTTGDGMSLLFFRDLLAPVRVAVQLDEELKVRRAWIESQIGQAMHMRIGLHTGPVFILKNINNEREVAGEGITIAARIMNCGDAGHILLSQQMADALGRIEPWRKFIQPVGETPAQEDAPTKGGRIEIKHDEFLKIYSLHGHFPGRPAFGNELPPTKLFDTKVKSRKKEIERTAKFNQLDRELWIRSYLRIGGMIVGTLAAVGIVGFVKVHYNITGADFALALETVKQNVTSALSPDLRSSPLPSGDAPPSLAESPSPTPEPIAKPAHHSTETDTFDNYVSQSLENAREAAHLEGVTIEVAAKKEYSDDYPIEDTILRQTPDGGTPRRGRRKITVVVSRGLPLPTPDPAETPTATPGEAPAAPVSEYTGVLIDAKGALKKRVDFNAVVADDISEVCSQTTENLGLYTTRDAAKPRCGAHPLELRARLKGAYLTLNAEDSRRWNEASAEIKDKIAIIYGD